MKKLYQKREEFIDALNLDPNEPIDQDLIGIAEMSFNAGAAAFKELSSELFEKV